MAVRCWESSPNGVRGCPVESFTKLFGCSVFFVIGNFLSMLVIDFNLFCMEKKKKVPSRASNAKRRRGLVRSAHHYSLIRTRGYAFTGSFTLLFFCFIRMLSYSIAWYRHFFALCLVFVRLRLRHNGIAPRHALSFVPMLRFELRFQCEFFFFYWTIIINTIFSSFSCPSIRHSYWTLYRYPVTIKRRGGRCGIQPLTASFRFNIYITV